MLSDVVLKINCSQIYKVENQIEKLSSLVKFGESLTVQYIFYSQIFCIKIGCLRSKNFH
jgi:hypothetical protein